MFKTFIAVLTICVIFDGCAEKQIIRVPKKVIVYKELPNSLLEDDIPLPKPVNKDAFIKATPIVREVMLAHKCNDLYKTIGSYRLKLKQIRDYNSHMIKIIKETK